MCTGSHVVIALQKSDGWLLTHVYLTFASVVTKCDIPQPNVSLFVIIWACCAQVEIVRKLLSELLPRRYGILRKHRKICLRSVSSRKYLSRSNNDCRSILVATAHFVHQVIRKIKSKPILSLLTCMHPDQERARKLRNTKFYSQKILFNRWKTLSENSKRERHSAFVVEAQVINFNQITKCKDFEEIASNHHIEFLWIFTIDCYGSHCSIHAIGTQIITAGEPFWEVLNNATCTENQSLPRKQYVNVFCGA